MTFDPLSTPRPKEPHGQPIGDYRNFARVLLITVLYIEQKSLAFEYQCLHLCHARVAQDGDNGVGRGGRCGEATKLMGKLERNNSE